jgi:gluconolactonase
MFDVDIKGGKVPADGFAPGAADGMRCDIEGNLGCSMGWAHPKEDVVRGYSPQGELLGEIRLLT